MSGGSVLAPRASAGQPTSLAPSGAAPSTFRPVFGVSVGTTSAFVNHGVVRDLSIQLPERSRMPLCRQAAGSSRPHESKTERPR